VWPAVTFLLTYISGQAFLAGIAARRKRSSDAPHDIVLR
jgi:hypothetical protein